MEIKEYVRKIDEILNGLGYGFSDIELSREAIGWVAVGILSEMRKDERLAESKKPAWPIPNTQTPPKPETPKPQPTAQPSIPMTENQIKYCKANGLDYSGWDFDRAYREIGQHKREMGLR